MRSARWALLIAGGVLLIGAGLLFLPAWSQPVQVQVLGETNGCRTVLITNVAKRVYYVMAWSEYQRNNRWCPDHSTLPHAQDSLDPTEGFAAQVVMPTSGRKRVVVLYFTTEISMFTTWLHRVKKLVGINTKVPTIYIEVS